MDFEKRTQAAVAGRYWKLTSERGLTVSIKNDHKYTSFLDGLQTLKTNYDTLFIENRELKKRVAELELQSDDYEALLSIMERARKLAFLVEEDEGPRFNMDRNGNLELVK